jgi:hypothetical protein
MDIETLKEALGDEKFAALKTYVDDLTGQRDAARNESITGRKGLKEKLAKLESDQAALLEKLGLDSLDDLDSLPDAKGAAEAAKQYEAKTKRLERQLAEATAAREQAEGKFKDSLRRATIADALGGHEFIARDVVETFVSNRLTWEGDDLLFKTDDGKLVPVKDGVAGIAKTRPELLKPTGAGGAGVRQSNAGGGATAKTITRAQYAAMSVEDRAAQKWSDVVITD